MPLASRRILAVALCGAALLAVLPQSAQAPWSSGLASVLWAPLRPAASALAWLRDRVRTPEEPYPGLPEELRAALEERDRLRGELDAADLRITKLERELGELTGYRPAERAGWRPRLASVVERSGRPAALLGIDIGSSQGVAEGDPAVVGGNQLLGLVAAGGSEARSWVIPVDDRRAGRIDAVVHPAGSAGTAGADGRQAAKGPRPTVLVQLVPQGNRTLVGELEPGADGRAADVRPGDAVLLSDASWRPAAQGMRIGLVESVGALDANPLRRRITVRMESDPTRVGRLVVKVRDAAQQGAAR